MRLNPFHVIIPFPARQCCQYNSLSLELEMGRGEECRNVAIRGEESLFIIPRYFISFSSVLYIWTFYPAWEKCITVKKGYHLSIYGLYFWGRSMTSSKPFTSQKSLKESLLSYLYVADISIVSIALNWTKYVGNSQHFINFTRSNLEFRFKEKYVIVPRCYRSLEKHLGTTWICFNWRKSIWEWRLWNL